MSEETKRILNLIFNITVEVKKTHYGISLLPPGLSHPIYQSTLREIRKQFPEFEPRELPVYKEIKPIGL